MSRWSKDTSKLGDGHYGRRLCLHCARIILAGIALISSTAADERATISSIDAFLCELNDWDKTAAQNIACATRRIRDDFDGPREDQLVEIYLFGVFEQANEHVRAVKKMNGDPRHVTEIARIIGGMLLTQRATMRSNGVPRLLYYVSVMPPMCLAHDTSLWLDQTCRRN